MIFLLINFPQKKKQKKNNHKQYQQQRKLLQTLRATSLLLNPSCRGILSGMWRVPMRKRLGHS
jgi:hypothetical protein